MAINILLLLGTIKRKGHADSLTIRLVDCDSKVNKICGQALFVELNRDIYLTLKVRWTCVSYKVDSWGGEGWDATTLQILAGWPSTPPPAGFLIAIHHRLSEGLDCDRAVSISSPPPADVT